MISFTDLGDINNELVKHEQDTVQHPPIATHVLTLMGRGFLLKIKYPYAHFLGKCLTAEFMYPIEWEAIRHLEADGVKALCVTADGASPNRKFSECTEHLIYESIPYKAKNVYTDEECWVYFIFDPCHLVKKVRNC